MGWMRRGSGLIERVRGEGCCFFLDMSITNVIISLGCGVLVFEIMLVTMSLISGALRASYLFGFVLIQSGVYNARIPSAFGLFIYCLTSLYHRYIMLLEPTSRDRPQAPTAFL